MDLSCVGAAAGPKALLSLEERGRAGGLQYMAVRDVPAADL